MKLNKKLLVVISSCLIFSCGDANPLDSGGDSDSDKSGGEVSASSLEDIGLSSALSLTTPDELALETTSLALLEGQRSHEACEIRNTIREGLDAIESVANMFCHFEAESEKIKFGVKTKVEFEGLGLLEEDEDAEDEENEDEDEDFPEYFKIWIDNSDGEKLTVYFCEGDDLTEKIVVEGAADGKARGYVISHGGDDDETWGRSAIFDNKFTDANITKLLSKDMYERESEGELFRRLLGLKLDYSEDGVHTVHVAHKGTWQGDTFQSRGAAKIGPEYGMAIYSGGGTDPEGFEFSFTHTAFFDNEGYVVGSDETEDFNAGGGLRVADKDVPGFLSKKSNPKDFGADDWDCGEVEETVSLNPESESHLACDGSRDWDGEDCWGDAYEQGDDHELNEDEIHDADELDDEEL